MLTQSLALSTDPTVNHRLRFYVCSGYDPPGVFHQAERIPQLSFVCAHSGVRRERPRRSPEVSGSREGKFPFHLRHKLVFVVSFRPPRVFSKRNCREVDGRVYFGDGTLNVAQRGCLSRASACAPFPLPSPA